MKCLSCLSTLAALLLSPPSSASPAAGPRPLPTVVAQASSENEATSFDGVVEAVRQTAIAAQVSGPIVALEVKAGDRVKAGQVLARIDARAATQNAAASDAQVRSAQAALDAADKAFARQQQLHQQHYISQTALEHAEAQYKATQAQVAAQLALAGAARVEAGYAVVKAPYAGTVAEVAVSLGDMATPGRALLTLYDPAALRVKVAVPQRAAGALAPDAALYVEVGDRHLVPTRVTVLPAADAATHTVQLRLDLPAGADTLAPGMFARAWLALGARGPRIAVPAGAVVRRAELTGLYVLDAQGRPLLRQVRLGSVTSDGVEVLSGLSAGERVVLDPQAAARVRVR